MLRIMLIMVRIFTIRVYINHALPNIYPHTRHIDRRTDHVEAVSKEIETAANLATNPSNDRSEGKAFAATADEPAPTQVKSQDAVDAALPFTNAEDLLQLCLSQNKTIAQVVYQV